MIDWITFGPTIDDARLVNPIESKRALAIVIAIYELHAPCSRTRAGSARPSVFGSMKSMVLGRIQTRGCTPRTPTCCDNFGCRHQSCHVPARYEKMCAPPKPVRPDTDHSPKREYNRHNICRDKLKPCISGQNLPRKMKASSLAIFFESNFQWRWMYQNATMLIVDVPPCTMPRYAFSRKENVNWVFWQILTRVVVVFRP